MGATQSEEAVKSPEKTLSEESASSQSPEKNDPFGEPAIQPRVGNEYQVEIPGQLTESELLQYRKNPAEEPNGVPDVCRSVLIGQPIPITWVYSQAEHIKDEPSELHDTPHVKHYTNGSLELESPKQCNGSSFKKDRDSDSKKDPCFLVPGFSTESWTDFEVDCFVLGLYVFGKNLRQVARFVETKDVGQVQLFFYGKFYRTYWYCRWSACRKMKRRKCIIGDRFFTGCRQQELFSRLLPGLSEESKLALQRVSKAFADGRTQLEEYVTSLKSLVGLQTLVDAVRIGKKEDLTTLVMDSSKGGRTPPDPLKIPSGDAFSSLSCAQILELLSGDTRLTKAKSNDLFWAAVWPRLLAKGWHSELPNGDASQGSKNDLVFLVPGVKKFLKRKLRKRKHYFDVVTDVLKMVASEPELLVLEGEENEISNPVKANRWALEEKSDDDGSSHNNGRRCYLRPRVSTATKVLKFTVVDTSLSREDKPSVKRESKSLPLETKCSSLSVSQTKESGMESIGDSGKNSGITDMQLIDRPKNLSNGGDQKHVGLDSLEKTASPSVDGKTRPRGVPLASDPVIREPYCILSLPAVDAKTARRAKRRRSRLQEMSFGGPSAKSSSQVQDTNLSQKTNEELKPKHSFDLNLPPESPAELPVVEERPIETKGNEPEPISKKLLPPPPVRQHEVKDSMASPSEGLEQAEGAKDDRRHGKRNRPMSTKALEALESCLMTTPKKKRSSLNRSEGESSKHPCQSKKKTNASANAGDASVKETEDRNNVEADHGLPRLSKSASKL